LKDDKVLLFGNLEAIKLYSMRETLEVYIAYTIIYSLLILVVIMLIVFLCFIIEKISTRQYAWALTKLMFSAHQRLNVEHPNNNLFDHSKSINRFKYYENKDNFHQ
jgi:hypothetical protein